MTLPVVLEAGEDGFVVAECPALPGCVTQGRSEAEALENIREAIAAWVAVETAKHSGSRSADAKVVQVAL